MSELSEIDKIRWQRDTAMAERDRLESRNREAYYPIVLC